MGEKITFCRGGGCTAKLGAGILSRVLERLPKGPEDPNLLIGYDSKDDAAVYKVSDDIAIVQTLDFFPPMVEDPYTYGESQSHIHSEKTWLQATTSKACEYQKEEREITPSPQ